MNRGLRSELSTLLGVAALATNLVKRRKAAGILAAAAVVLRLLPSAARRLDQAVVVITGGSRGLGLALADRLLSVGARVVLLARDHDELRRARNGFPLHIRHRIMTIPCDITDEPALHGAIAKVEAEWHRIDVLINNAGIITVGPFEHVERDDYESMLELSLYAVVSATKAVLPIFLRQRKGWIVNICSIGGKIGVPHMSAYNAGKFALAGLSQTMSADLAPRNIGVTTVYPGMMRVGSTIQARFKGDPEKEYAWFAMVPYLPLASIGAEAAAARIVDGLQNGDAEVQFPFAARAAVLGHAVFPETSNLVRRAVARLLPSGAARKEQTGAASSGWLERRRWYRKLLPSMEATRARWNQQ
jgi:NADP-dependent 3-hydroxy acid dehydrogenase YdfG